MYVYLYSNAHVHTHIYKFIHIFNKCNGKMQLYDLLHFVENGIMFS